ncbi:MAG: hypothetical protein WCR83_06680 [Candidatus Methanomethylophilaceae archaeon]
MIQDPFDPVMVLTPSPEEELTKVPVSLDECESSMIANSMVKITREEQVIIEYALNNNDLVNLPMAIKWYSQKKEARNKTPNAIYQAVSRAAKRLENRGLAILTKGNDMLVSASPFTSISKKNGKKTKKSGVVLEDDGLTWIHLDRKKTWNFMKTNRLENCTRRRDDINLIKVPCEIPTFSSGYENLNVKSESKKKAKTDLCELPKRASAERIKACKLLTGLRWLARVDKVAINTHFETYTEDVNEKIITLLDTNNGEIIGSEYSTRFNDLGKAAKSLRKFDYALDKSLEDHSKSVFLTLTTDPNLTDDERAALRRAKKQSCIEKLKNPNITDKTRRYLMKKLYQVEGPDYEISELKRMIDAGCLSKSDLATTKQRLSKLENEKAEAEILQEAVDDPRTPIRRKEDMISSLKKMNRWVYKHDPFGFHNLYEADRHFSGAWNKFLSYLTKKNNGKRPRYLASYEFTETGLLHVHVLIFMEFLMPYKEISKEWRRCGQGEISYIYSLKNVKSRDGSHREWRWSSLSRPQDAKGMSGGDYLKKYVKKCMLALTDNYTSPSEIQSMYWAVNKRMYTCSRSLMPKTDKDIVTEIPPETQYSFFKIFCESDAEQWVDRMIYHRIRPGWKKTDPPDNESEAVV